MDDGLSELGGNHYWIRIGSPPFDATAEGLPFVYQARYL